MTSGTEPASAGGAGALTPVGSASAATDSSGGGVSNLADVLERVLDKGVVIVGDIRVNLLDIELLTIKLRLLVAGVDTARRIGINWWENDPWLTGHDDEDGRSLRERVRRIERALEPGEGRDSLEDENAELHRELSRLRRELGRKSSSGDRAR